MATIGVPKRVDSWSLTGVQQRLVKTEQFGSLKDARAFGQEAFILSTQSIAVTLSLLPHACASQRRSVGSQSRPFSAAPAHRSYARIHRAVQDPLINDIFSK